MDEQEVDLRDYIRVLWRGKWIVLATFVVAVGAALGISYSMPKQYQTQTGLLILPPLAEEVGGRVSGTVFSPETYKNLALARDLLEKVIMELYPRDGRHAVEALRDATTVEVEQTAVKEFPGQFPLYLRVTFKGEDPETLTTLAECWAQHFIARNAEIFTTRTAQSYKYVQENFEQVEQELLSKEGERKRFQQENPVELLQAEVSVLQSDYQEYLGQLRQKRKELSSKEATLAALQETIAEEPKYLVLERTVSNEALWNFLAQGASVEKLSALPSLTLQDQQLNSVYMQLRAQLASVQVEVETLRGEIAYLEAVVETTRTTLEERRARLIEVQAELERLDREISILKASYTSLAGKLQEARIAKAETAGSIRIVEAPVVPTRPIGPSTKMNVAVAGVLGLFIGVLLAFFAHYLRFEGEESPPPPQGEGPDRS